MKILIYGVGGFTRRYFPITREIIENAGMELMGFVDSKAVNFQDGYVGFRVYSPAELPNIDFDRVYIFTYDDAGVYRDIYYRLRDEHGINENLIGNIADLLSDAQYMIRNRGNAVQTRPARIYDCMQFFNEIEILHMRLEILSPYVDRFVIVEMNKDHHGRSKPYYLQERLDEFEEYKDRLIIVHPEENEIPEYSEEAKNEYGHIWTIEQFQRRCISKGLTDAEPEDIILISDCDEIPDPRILVDIRKDMESAYSNIICKMLEKTAIALRQEYYYFFFNCRNRMRKNTTTIVKYKNMINPQVIRDVMNCLPYIDYGGWHLTYFGGVDRIRTKMASIVEGVDVNDETILERITSATDIYGRVGDEFELDFLPLEKITIPDIDKWIERYPQFYLTQ